ncbi:hydrolase [Mycobacterium alsense]|uniref:Adenylate/guanylate cyclase domain-containing protein n=1 Tax=Mycobacterium alsense TaxID=324058 RepID=A0AA41XSC8_9MYCO|nr:adenylate/guanylate cyclase domain-containing protein [Mycobacterium alsense]MCV7380804.1 adenylate/guanylate cyclase domain-containing protein [Mycobacterium alsense]OBG43596.1 hydrolase [Mycobacterium alsense]OQZ91876.1 adenylate/guanylate cyclase domain-containing protein [Mycobacterium alsense]
MNVAGRPPDIRYAKNGDLNIAYFTTGEGPDLVVAPGFISHLEIMWEEPSVVHFYSRLASFRRVITFDKRGTGLSDPATHAPTLEETVDDLRAVMDATGCESADLLGISEGGTMSMLMTASHPERVNMLALYGAFPRLLRAPDYPLGVTEEQLSRMVELSTKGWGEGVALGGWAPSRRGDSDLRRWWARLQRMAASPGMVRNIFALYPQLDIRDVLPAIRLPTLVLHRRDDRMVSVEMGRYLADCIAGAKFVELDGADHLFFTGDADALLDEVEEFLTGVRPLPAVERVLATVLFTDIVDSTKRAVELGDERWKVLLGKHDAQVRRQLERFRGREVNTTGDGFLARFDGPARAIRCAMAIRDVLRSLGLEVRAGVHTGEVELRDDDISGIAVHIAARVAAAAGPGEVLVSRTVVDLVAGSGLSFAARGEHTLKGVAGEWRLFAVDN